MKLWRPLVLSLLIVALVAPRVAAQQTTTLQAREIIAAGVVVVGAVVLLAVLVHATHKKPQARPSPCSPPVPPIRNNNILITVFTNYTYTLRDPDVRHTDPGWIVDRLNGDGAADGNHFALANGQPQNLTLDFTFNSDANDHFSGSLNFSGWGQGHIATLTSGQNTWTQWYDMAGNMVDQAYGFIHSGWHDSRPGCGGGELEMPRLVIAVPSASAPGAMSRAGTTVQFDQDAAPAVAPAKIAIQFGAEAPSQAASNPPRETVR
jgi:hypothetical protein